MKYTIISINDDRAKYKERIRQRVGLEEVSIPATDAGKVDIDEELSKRGLRYTRAGETLMRGEIGVWLSTYDCWKWVSENNEELIVFEDDAIPSQEFDNYLGMFYSELPTNYDFLCLWVPKDQYPDYRYDVTFDSDGKWRKIGKDRSPFLSNYNYGAMRLAKVYNGYGNVAQLYSPRGGSFFSDRARTTGLTEPVDCYVYTEARTGRCAGYAPKPNWAKAVGYDWKAKTTVHNTERVL
jgi:GR25 family glycosyltransferase involved in LPS biosynthesis